MLRKLIYLSSFLFLLILQSSAFVIPGSFKNIPDAPEGTATGLVYGTHSLTEDGREEFLKTSTLIHPQYAVCIITERELEVILKTQLTFIINAPNGKTASVKIEEKIVSELKIPTIEAPRKLVFCKLARLITDIPCAKLYSGDQRNISGQKRIVAGHRTYIDYVNLVIHQWRKTKDFFSNLDRVEGGETEFTFESMLVNKPKAITCKLEKLEAVK